MRNAAFFIIYFLIAHSLFSQSMILKGHLINGNTNEPISGARLYILGGDSEDQTTSTGQYRLNLDVNNNLSYGDKINIYILHSFYGFHKKEVTINKDLSVDITIEPDNMVKITGTVIDANSGDPISGISVNIIDEKSLEENDNEIISITDEFGAFYFLVSQSIVGEQLYAKFRFLDTNKDLYFFKEEILPLQSHSKIYLRKKIQKSSKDLKQALAKIKFKVSRHGIGQKSRLVIDKPRELYNALFYYSFNNKEYYECDRTIEFAGNNAIYIKVKTKNGDEIGIIEKSGLVYEHEKKLLKEMYNSKYLRRVLECYLTKVTFDLSSTCKLHAKNITLSRFPDHPEYTFDKMLCNEDNSTTNKFCLDASNGLFPITPNEEIYLTFVYPDESKLQLEIMPEDRGDYDEHWYHLKPLDKVNEAPFVAATNVGEGTFRLYVGGTGKCSNLSRYLYEIDDKGKIEFLIDESSTYYRFHNSFAINKIPKHNYLSLEIEYLDGITLGPFKYDFDIDSIILKSIKLHNTPPRIKCKFWSNNKINCTTSGDVQQWLNVDHVIYGNSKNNLTDKKDISFKPIEIISNVEFVRSNLKTPLIIGREWKDLYYQIHFKDKTKSEIFRISLRE